MWPHKFLVVGVVPQCTHVKYFFLNYNYLKNNYPQIHFPYNDFFLGGGQGLKKSSGTGTKSATESVTMVSYMEFKPLNCHPQNKYETKISSKLKKQCWKYNKYWRKIFVLWEMSETAPEAPAAAPEIAPVQSVATFAFWISLA